MPRTSLALPLLQLLVDSLIEYRSGIAALAWPVRCSVASVGQWKRPGMALPQSWEPIYGKWRVSWRARNSKPSIEQVRKLRCRKG